MSLNVVYRGERGSVSIKADGHTIVKGCVGTEGLKQALKNDERYPEKISDFVGRTLDASLMRISGFFDNGGLLLSDGRQRKIAGINSDLESDVAKRRLIIDSVAKFRDSYGIDFEEMYGIAPSKKVVAAAGGLTEGLSCRFGAFNMIIPDMIINDESIRGFYDIRGGLGASLQNAWDKLPFPHRTPFVPDTVVKQQLYDLSQRE